MGKSVGSRPARASTLGRILQKFRDVILQAVPLMFCERFCSHSTALELPALGPSRCPATWTLLGLSFSKKHKYPWLPKWFSKTQLQINYLNGVLHYFRHLRRGKGTKSECQLCYCRCFCKCDLSSAVTW